MLLLQSVLLGCLFGFSACAGNHDWSYKDIQDWSHHYPNCDLKKQSPINIVTSEAPFKSRLSNSLSFIKYDFTGVGNKFTAVNNGHTLSTDVSSVGASISLKKLGMYNLAQFHFHWGSDDSKGSEHQFNGRAYPAELHLVHYRNDFDSVTEAKTHVNGLAVLGVMIERGDENPAFHKFLDLLKHVTETGAKVTIDAFKIENLLPKYTGRFYRYQGSLTTPTCDQSVTWTLFERPIQISEEQLNEFRKLKSHGEDLVNNFRPVQNLNGRTVFSSFSRHCNSLRCKMKLQRQPFHH